MGDRVSGRCALSREAAKVGTSDRRCCWRSLPTDRV